MPVMHTTAAIKGGINSLIETGEFLLGEPCSPFTLTKNTGIVESRSVVVYGRKLPLTEVRTRILTIKQEKFMHLFTDEKIGAMTSDELKSCISKVEEPSGSLDDLRRRLKSLQRTHHLALWHDHSSILGAGYILMTVHVLYDPAVFLNNSEYKDRTGDSLDVQEIVEEPELYI